MSTQIETFVGSPWVQLVIGILLLIADRKVTNNNILATFGWLVFVVAIFRAPVISSQAMVPRLLWTMLLSAGAGLLLFYLVQPSPKLSEAVVTAPAAPASSNTSATAPVGAPLPEPPLAADTSAPPRLASTSQAKAPVIKKHEKPAQTTSGNNSPIVNQAPGSVAQLGNNNQINVYQGPPKLQITLTQRSILTNTLKPFAGQKAKLLLDQGNQETGQFMQHLADAMRDAGIEIVELNFANMLFTEKPTSFLYFYVNTSVPGMLPFAEAVIRAVGQAGIASGNFDAAPGDNAELVIWVRRP